MILTLQYLKKRLDYNPASGTWTWLSDNKNQTKNNRIAGYLDRAGYRHIEIDGKNYPSARLAWFYMTGNWPSLTVDHKDRNRSNDAWNNLRLATMSQQQFNKNPRPRKGKSLPKWVYERGNGYQAMIRHNGKLKHLAFCKTPEEAHEIAKQFALSIQGEFCNAGLPSSPS